MQTQNRLLDDLARVASGALGVAAGMRAEVEGRLRDQFERVLAQLDLVNREEFDAVKAMAVKAREEQEELAARLARLEAGLASRGAGADGRKSPKKPHSKRTARTKGSSSPSS